MVNTKDNDSVMPRDDLRKAQLLQLKILKEVHRVCVKNNIKYFLLGGTLIGAIRHQGFIPWDDDIDIGMFRDDYEKFFRICQTELHEEYIVQSRGNDPGYGESQNRILLKNTLWVDAISKNCKYKYLYIDIFPYDTVPPGKWAKRIQFAKYCFWQGLMFMKRKYSFPSDSCKRILLKIFAPTIIIFMSDRFISSMLDKTITKYNKFTDSKEYTKMLGVLDYFKSINRSPVLENLILHQFEDSEFFIPEAYDEMLCRTFGDYMTLPPDEERNPHHSIIKYDFGDY